MDDHIRVSDADRERVTARLREHYAEGRLTSDELEERISAALSAKTFGDLRAIMADLPDSEFAPPQAPPPAMAPWGARNTFVMPRPRLLPLVLLALFVATAIAAARFRRNLRRNWKSGYWQSQNGDQWRRWHYYHHHSPWDQSAGQGSPRE
jgi:Domain of unknown function (DUF1707)